MSTRLKSFRLNQHLVAALEEMAKEQKVSEASVLEMALTDFFEEAGQWDEDLRLMAEDKAYQNEQIDLAEEIYED